MSPIRLRICPNMPMFNTQRGYSKAREACLKIKRAEEILLQAFDGITSYSNAHRTWMLAQGQCEHGVKFYHASQECPSCDLIEQELNELYEDNWEHLLKESAV